ncbi:MAG TPA: T9SS type A sorting domain-containing protein [Candidatus Limnocylindria bacterium]|nr:T9SS type A sorting domain-containing protein [Candidatus Limnocylindria bacterium]
MTLRFRARWTSLAIAVLAAALIETPLRAAAGEMSVEQRARQFKQTQRAKLMEGARHRLARARKLAKTKPPAAGSGARRRVPADMREPGGRQGAAQLARDHRFDAPAPERLQANLAPNRQLNNRAGDNPDAGQAEVSIAALGVQAIAAWNDGQGFHTGLSTQGYAYSNDGGQTWIDGGAPPVTGGIGEWTSDPVLTVNEKTGTFYFAALCNPSGSTNGVGVVRGTFVGGVLTWGTPKLVRSVNNSSNFLDKVWVVADSASGNLYVSYTNFTPSANQIDFQIQTDPTNVAAWSTATTISSAGDAGLVQASRPAMGPDGELYVVWAAIGPIDVDFFRVRKSTTAGATFGSQVTAASYFANFGTGAPGFNRGMGITFPSLAVDRSSGPFRGRVYLTWNESINFYNDNLGTSTTVLESESNDLPGTADLFTASQNISGQIGNINDFDYYRFSGAAGQTIICALSESDADLICSFRIFCTDQNSRLAFSDSEANGQALVVFTLPTTGDYFLRVASLTPSSGGPAGTGAYTIDTGFNGAVTERSRDHRDVFTTTSTTGTSWTTPVRASDSPANRDDWLPDVGVSSAGKPYLAWYDWRDAPASICGSGSHTFLTRSEDGGVSWLPGSPVTDVRTDWTNIVSNIAPNQGDYICLFANNDAVYVAWSDGRNSDVDVFMGRVDLAFTAIQVSLAHVSAESDRVQLVWHVAADRPVTTAVYRRTESSDWNVIASPAPNGAGLVEYADRDVAPGSRYGYRLGIDDGQGEVLSGEAWIEVPSTARFALQGARPNPTDRDLWIGFSLAGPEPATLELLDIAGRRVRERAVGTLGAGSHLVNLNDGSPLQPGVYVVRLVQGERSLTARVSVIR